MLNVSHPFEFAFVPAYCYKYPGNVVASDKIEAGGHIEKAVEMAAISFRLAAIVALLSVIVIHGARAQPSYNGTDDSQDSYYDDSEGFYNGTEGRALFSRSWLPARATWYGKPNGAGPDNGGMMRAD